MVSIICPPPVGIGLTDLPNIGGASGPPAPPVPAPLNLCFKFFEEFVLGKFFNSKIQNSNYSGAGTGGAGGATGPPNIWQIS